MPFIYSWYSYFLVPSCSSSRKPLSNEDFLVALAFASCFEKKTTCRDRYPLRFWPRGGESPPGWCWLVRIPKSKPSYLPIEKREIKQGIPDNGQPLIFLKYNYIFCKNDKVWNVQFISHGPKAGWGNSDELVVFFGGQKHPHPITVICSNEGNACSIYNWYTPTGLQTDPRVLVRVS